MILRCLYCGKRADCVEGDVEVEYFCSKECMDKYVEKHSKGNY
jgi:ribosomal protein L24E